MRRRLSALVLLLMGTALHAETPFATGDVLVSRGGGCFPGFGNGCAELQKIDIVGHDGIGKRTMPLPLWSRERGVLATTERVIFGSSTSSVTGSSVVSVSNDGLTVSTSWLKELGLWTLTNIVPLRSGEFLVGEQSPWVLSRLVKFDGAGQVTAVYTIPPEPWLRGASVIEVFADQCTVAWTPNYMREQTDVRLLNSVRAFDICANAPRPDLLVRPGEWNFVYDIRQLSNGDLLLATARDLERYDRGGAQVAVYPYRELNGFALTPDGRGFWTSTESEVRRIEFAAPDVVAARFAGALFNPGIIGVVGEWRASLQPAPPARRRSMRH